MADLASMYKTWKSWIGQRVCVKKSTFGTLKYFGEIKFKDGIWCGVELDEPVGENDGMINNMQYFKCKDYYGIFVPVYETTRLKSTSSEVNSVRDLIKLKYAGDKDPSTSTDGLHSTFSQNQNTAKLEPGNEINKSQPRSSSDLNKTFCKNELKNIPDEFDFKVPNERFRTHYIEDKKYDNVSKRSKNTCGRLETEESLGIISDLFEGEESWNLLDQSITKRIRDKCLIQKSSDEIDIDSVFYPLTETSHLDSRPNLCTEQVDSSIQKSSNSKYTSTPKRCSSNVLDLNGTVKLDDDKQSFDFLHDEPIVAGSSKLNFETDFDLARFKQSDILCSTLKSLSSLPIQYSASDEISCANNKLAKSKKNFNYQDAAKVDEENCNKIPAISNAFANTKQFENIHEGFVEENSDILNTTFTINSDLLSSPTAGTSLVVKNYNPHTVLESQISHLNNKSNCVMQMDSTFVTHNIDENVSDGEKTFIIDCSPINIPKISSLEHETIPKKKTLSIIFEKANSENSVFKNAPESEDEPNNITNNESFISSTLSSEDTNKVIKSSLLKNASDLNSTFCISSDASTNKKNTAYLGVKKRYSLSSISIKNNVCIKKEKSVVTSLKANGRKSITESRLSVITKKKSLGSSSTNSTSSLKQFKDIELRDKNVTEVTSNKFLEMMPRRKLKKTCSTSVESSSDIAFVKEQLKKTLGSCKSVDNLGVKKENESNLTLKISENNSKFVEKCKGVLKLPTKAQKIPSSFKEISSEYSNFNRKVNELTNFHECNSKNPLDVKHGINHRHSMLPTDLTNSENSNLNCEANEVTGFHEVVSKNTMGVKLGNIKHRHSMLPTVLRNSTRTKNSISKDRSAEKCIKNAVKSSFVFSESKSVPPSKIHHQGFGNTRSTEREYMEKKSVPAEKVLENNIKYDKKKENSTILKSKLLKPGTLSRLPVPEKLSKKPGCILNSVETQSQHNFKSVNKTDNRRTCQRLPLQKLQDKH